MAMMMSDTRRQWSARRLASALEVLESRKAWSTGRSKTPGRPDFWIIPSRTVTGTAHWVAKDARGCTCEGFRRRGQCAHVDAVVLIAPKPAPIKRYEDLFSEED